MTVDEIADVLVADVRAYVDSAIAKALAALPPPIPGPQGEKGEPGSPGRSGERGEPGDRGERGERGEKGLDGKDGRDAKDGRDGRDGKDGIASLDQLMSIVTAEVERRLADEVHKGVAAALAEMPILMHRGGFVIGRSYKPGEAVSWGGSSYVCNAPTSDKPDVSESWTLLAKKGRDGRDK